MQRPRPEVSNLYLVTRYRLLRVCIDLVIAGGWSEMHLVLRPSGGACGAGKRVDPPISHGEDAQEDLLGF